MEPAGLFGGLRPVCLGCVAVRPTRDVTAMLGLLTISGLVALGIAAAIWMTGGGTLAMVFVVSLPAGRALATVCHEAGHAAAAAAMGARLLSIKIGSGAAVARLMVRGVLLQLGRYPVAGQTIYVWPSALRRWREFDATLAGPGLNLIVGALAAGAAMAVWDTHWIVAILAGLGLPQVVSGLLNLIPLAARAGGAVTDGRHALELLHGRPEVESLAAVILSDAERHAILGHHGAAVHAIGRALELAPDQPVLLAEALRFVSQAEGAAASLAFYRARTAEMDRALAGADGPAASRLEARIARAALDAGALADPALADRLSASALARDPTAPLAQGVRGAVLLARGDRAAAEPLLLGAVREAQDPDDRAAFCRDLSALAAADGHPALAEAWLALGRYAGAAQYRYR